MTDWKLTTPVVFMVFNRPDTTAQVFKTIRQAKPPRLYVAADGPRPERSGEDKKVKETRQVIMDNIDWKCEVYTLFRDNNLGCRQAVSQAIDWFFENEDAGIILEDDCLPHPTFFRFCEELLSYYRYDDRVMCISGDNFQFGRRRTSDSYYFSHYSHIWGWATWRRAWCYYDIKMKLWPILREQGWLDDILLDPQVIEYWDNVFQSTYDNIINTWDYQWFFSCWSQSGLTILPNVNLVSNIGFDQHATHTITDNHPLENLPVRQMEFPLKHPKFVIRDTKADIFTQKNIITANYPTRIKKKLFSILDKLKNMGFG